MLNQTILCGRIVSDVEVLEVDGKQVSTITLAVSKNYKNADGYYETDSIPCVLWNGIATKTKEYCRKGDMVGVKGRLEVENNELKVIAEKVTFLSSAKNEKKEK